MQKCWQQQNLRGKIKNLKKLVVFVILALGSPKQEDDKLEKNLSYKWDPVSKDGGRVGERREVEKGEMDSYFHISKSISLKKKKKQGLTLYLIWSGVPYADWAGLKLKEIQPMPPKSCWTKSVHHQHQLDHVLLW